MNPFQIALVAGVVIKADVDMISNGLSGRLDTEGGTSTISYNPTDALIRQRFTIAHELGHLFLKHGRSMRDNARNYRSGIGLLHERDANSFAAELLIPKEAVDSLVFKQNVKAVARLAQVFNVSDAAMRFRLRELGLIK